MSELPASAFELGRDGPRSIVVGVDGSLTSERAGAYAAGVARRQSSQLVVVYVRQIITDNALGLDSGVGAVVEAQEEVERHLREAIATAPWAVDARLEVRAGSPLRVLADVAEETAAGLVVLGSSRQHAYLRPGGPLPVQLMRMRRWPVLVVP